MDLKLAFLAVFILIFPVAADCSFLQVGVLGNSSVMQGALASFPIAIKNNGLGIQNVYLSVTNDHLDSINAYFDISSFTLAPSQEKVFTFFATTSSAESGTYRFPLEISSDAGTGFCTEYRTLLLTVLPTDIPPQEDEISVTLHPDELKQLYPGDEAEYTITVNNGLNEEIIATLDSVSNPFSDSTRYSESDFRIPSKSSKSVNAFLKIPPGSPGGDFEIVFRVRASTSCCLQEFLLPVNVRSFSKNVELKLLQYPLNCIEIEHGERAYVQLGVRNDGEITGPFSLKLSGGETDLSPIKLPLRQFELNSGERDYFNLTIFPRETMPLGIYRYRLQAKYLDFLLFDKELCYAVEGKSNLEIEKPLSASVKRCTTDSFEFKVRNTGTLEDEYAIEPKPLTKATPYIEPETFTLSPGASQVVNYIVQTTCDTPLGTQLASVVVRPQNAAAMTATMEFEVISSGVQGESLLEIDAPSRINAIAGEAARLIVNVHNNGEDNLGEVEVSVRGGSKDWFMIEGAKTIKAGRTAPYWIIIKAPTAGKFPLDLIASSGLELSKFETELQVVEPRTEVDYSHTIEIIREEEVAKEAILTLILRNTGNTQLTGITVSTPSQDLNIVPLDLIPDLKPGETIDVRFQIRPLQDTFDKDVLFRLTSNEGVENSQSIRLPALTKDDEPPAEFPWRIILIAILIIAILWVLAKQQL